MKPGAGRKFQSLLAGVLWLITATTSHAQEPQDNDRDLKKFRTLFENLTEQKNFDPAQAGYYAQSLGLIYRDRGRYIEAGEYLGLAERFYLSLPRPDALILGGIRYNQALVLMDIGDFPGALEILSALADPKKTPFRAEGPVGLWNIYDSLGTLLVELGRFDEARGYHQKALDLRPPGSLDFFISLTHMGSAQEAQGSYAEALKCYTQALDGYRTLGIQRSQQAAGLLNNLGILYGKMGDPDRSLAHFYQALEVYSQVSDVLPETLGGVYTNLGLAYQNRGNSGQAIVNYNKALEALGRSEVPHPRSGIIYNNLGALYQSLGKPREALESLEKALEIQSFTLGQDHPALAQVLNNLAGVYSSLGESGKAREVLENALRISRKATEYDHPDQGILFYNLGMFTAKDQGADPLENFERAFEIWGKYGLRDQSARRAWDLYQWSQEESPVIAAKAVEWGIQATESARLDQGAAKSTIFAQALPLYYAGVGVEAREHNLEKAFYYSESLRSRSFLEEVGTEIALRLPGISKGEKEEITSLSKEWSQLRSKLEEQGAIQGGDTKALIQAGLRLGEVESRLKNLDSILGERIPRYNQLRNPRAATLEQAGKWLGPERVLVEYVLWDPRLAPKSDKGPVDSQQDPGSWALVITQNGAKSVGLNLDFAALEADTLLIRNLMPLRRLTPPLQRELSQALARVHRLLIEPVESTGLIQGKKSLILVPDGPLAFLPFDLLRPGDLGPRLGEIYALSLSPSVSVSILKENQGENPSGRFLALGGARYENRNLPQNQIPGLRNTTDYFRGKGLFWPELPGTEEEVNQLSARVFNPRDSLVLTGDQATEARLKTLSDQGILRKYGYIHLAAHGYFDAQEPRFSSVVLGDKPATSEDGFLTLEEAALLNLNAQAVILSACQTGLGQSSGGEGILGLTRSFLVAGARQAGVSLWSLEDQAAKEFMVDVYTRVISGVSLAQAYKETKAVFSRDPKTQAPFYWAGFTLWE